MRKNIAKAFVSVVLSGLVIIPYGIPTGALELSWETTEEQPDGEELSLHSNFEPGIDLVYLSDNRGYIIVQDPETQYYVYANIKDKELVPGNVIVTEKKLNGYEDVDKINITDYYFAQEVEDREFPADFLNKEIELYSSDAKECIDLSGAELFVVDNCTMVPFRALADSYLKTDSYYKDKNLSNDIRWDGSSQEVTAIMGTRETEYIRFKVNDNTAYIRNKECILEVPPCNINGTVYVPLRFAAEAIGYWVGGKEIENGKTKILLY